MIDIKSKKIFIRKFRIKDIDNVYSSWFLDKNNLKYSRHKNTNINKKNLLNYFNSHQKNKNSLFLICIHKVKKEKLGTLTVYFDKQTNTADVGILIGNKNYKNKGLSGVILKRIFKYLFWHFRLSQITMGTSIHNHAMIKSCLSIGMRVQNNFSNKIQKKFFFRINIKKIKNVGVICKDLGAAHQIYYYLLSQKNKIFLLYLEEPAKTFFKNSKYKKFIILDNIDKLLRYSSYVISGSGTSNFEKKNMLKVKKNNLYLMSVVDHITNIRERFSYYEKTISPNEILVFDKFCFKVLIKNEFIKKKNIKITKLKNFYLIFLAKNFDLKKTNKDKLLFIGEPFKKYKKKLSVDQNALKNLSINLYKKYTNDTKLFIRLHPKQTMKDFKSYKFIINKHCENLKVYLDRNKNLLNSLKFTKYVFGVTSYALLVASYLKIKTFHCLNQSSKVKLLPDTKIKNLKYFKY